MAIRIQGLNSLNAKIKNLEKAVTADARLTTLIGARASSLVIDRTLKGRDGTGNKGKQFAKYAPSYKKIRAGKGRQGKVNLSFTGNMLSSIAHRGTKGHAVIFFRKAKENLKAHGLHFGNPRHNVPARPFFQLTRNEGRKIKRMISERVTRAVR